MKNYQRWLWTIVTVLTIAGGLVHAFYGAFHVNLLSMFSEGFGRFVQTIAGLSTVVLAGYGLRMIWSRRR